MKNKTLRCCDGCGKNIVVDSTTVMQRNCYIKPPCKQRKDILVTFCKCPGCDEVNILQIDDNITLQDLRELTKIISRRARSFGGAIPGKRNRDKEKAGKLNKRLDMRRTELLRACKGQEIYLKDETLLTFLK